MTSFLRTTFLAAVAVSALSGSSFAGQQQVQTCDKTNLSDWWSGRCCSVNDSNCLGRESHGRDHHDNGGHGPNGGGGQTGAAGKP